MKFISSVAAILVANFASGEELEPGSTHALELWDKNSDGVLTEDEVDMLILGLTGGVHNFCPHAHEIFELSGIPEGGNLSSATEINIVLANLYPCMSTLISGPSVSVSANDEPYSCVEETLDSDGDHDHDGHDHRRRLQEDGHEGHNHGSETTADMDIHLQVGNKTFHCTSNHSADATEEYQLTAEIWGKALGATFLACSASLVGATLLICFKSNSLDSAYLNDSVAFAVGVLLCAVFIHMIPEGLSLSDNGFSWQYGSGLLGGLFSAFTVEMVSNMIGGHHHDTHDLYNETHKHRDSDSNSTGSFGNDNDGVGVETGVVKFTERNDRGAVVRAESSSGKEVEKGKASKPRDMSLIINIVVGDGFHNFVDGILIGISFAVCSEVGWVVTAAVVCHELPQELVDFLILVRAGLSFTQALFWNFMSSLTAIFGCILVLAMGSDLHDNGRGMLLAFSSGFLLYIALAELTPTIVNIDSSSRKLFRLFLAIVGAIGIGLLQLFHVHC